MSEDVAAAPAPPKRPPGGVKTFSCPSCGGAIGVRAVGITLTATCQSCHSIVDVGNEELRIIGKASAATVKTALPIGARGKLFDAEWEVIGFSIRSDQTEQWQWREYLLFNPWQGFRFLIENDGHWNFVQMLRRQIPGTINSSFINFEGRSYKLFVKGNNKTLYVMGEFYWRVKVGESVRAADFVCPPYMLSVEKSDQDVIWSHAFYLYREEVAEAFGVKSLPSQRGVAPNQPSPFQDAYRGIRSVCAIFTVALVVLQLAAAGAASSQLLFERTVDAGPGDKGLAVISEPITIPGKSGNVEISALSPVSNNWVELGVSLENPATDDDYETNLSVEYYFGRDSDGSWTEGGQSTRTVLSGVDGGDYQLMVEPDAGVFAQGLPASFTLRVRRNVPVWSNFFVALMLMLVYPMFLGMRKRNFEVKRWSASDYSPYASDD
jgi:hypothetical protein